MDDWRIDNLGDGLRGASFVRKVYRAPSEEWDHDHCAACTAKLMEASRGVPDTLHEGYAVTDAYPLGEEYEWVCAPCFAELQAVMGWIDETPA